jgi:hypothetical protein
VGDNWETVWERLLINMCEASGKNWDTVWYNLGDGWRPRRHLDGHVS